MEHRTLGRTELRVSLLGLGGHTYPVGDDGFATHDQRAQLVRNLVDCGVNYFDTTWFEEVRLLADSFRRSGVGQDCLVSLQYVDGVSDPNWRDKLRAEVETRLEVMGWPLAPLFMMGIGNGEPEFADIAAALESMDRLRDEGLIRFIGLSCHQLQYYDLLAEVIEQTDLVDYVMIKYNFKYPHARGRLLPAAAAANVGVVAMKVFCWDCGPGQWGRRISVFEPVNGRHDDLAAQDSLRWGLQDARVHTVVASMNALWETKENVEAVETWRHRVDDYALRRRQNRLWRRRELERLAQGADSATIRQRAAALLEDTVSPSDPKSSSPE